VNKKIFVLLTVITFISIVLLAAGCDNSAGNTQSGDGNKSDSTVQNHEHSFESEWSSDNRFHWHAAACEHEVINDKAEHDFDGDGKCKVCKQINYNGFVFELNPDNESYTLKGLAENNRIANVTVPATYEGKAVTCIGSKAFKDCEEMISITIPSGIKEIRSFAFDGCDGLKGVYIFDMTSWLKIDFGVSDANPLEYARKLYLNNQLVTALTIPKEITEVDWYAFYNCVDLQSIEVEADNAVFKSQGNCLIEKQTDKLILGCNNSVIPDYVKSIGSGAFKGCRDLTEVQIPSGVTYIGFYAFENCVNLTEVAIPSGVQILCDGVFKNCKNLQRVELSTGLTKIGMFAFAGCSSLNDINIPLGITDIDQGAFASCVQLTRVIIPVGVTKIGSLAFVNCPKLTIYCQLSVPSNDWDKTWNGTSPVVWDYIAN